MDCRIAHRQSVCFACGPLRSGNDEGWAVKKVAAARKGIARVRLIDGTVHLAEVHWYEAAGIGRKEFKLKHLL